MILKLVRIPDAEFCSLPACACRVPGYEVTLSERRETARYAVEYAGVQLLGSLFAPEDIKWELDSRGVCFILGKGLQGLTRALDAVQDRRGLS